MILFLIGVTFRIEDVRSQNEIVYHIGQFVTQNKYFNIGDSAVVTLDGERRKQNARCHSGGHLLDVAVINLGLKDLKPGKVRFIEIIECFCKVKNEIGR